MKPSTLIVIRKQRTRWGIHAHLPVFDGLAPRAPRVGGAIAHGALRRPWPLAGGDCSRDGAVIDDRLLLRPGGLLRSKEREAHDLLLPRRCEPPPPA